MEEEGEEEGDKDLVEEGGRDSVEEGEVERDSGKLFTWKSIHLAEYFVNQVDICMKC